MDWLFFALLTAIFWGVGQVFLKKGLTHISPLFNNILALMVVLLINIPFTLIKGINIQFIPKIIFLALIVVLTYSLYYYFIGKGQLALTSTILATYPLSTLVFSIIFLNERLSIKQGLAIVLILMGAVFIALPKKTQDLKKSKLDIWLILAFIAAMTTGFGDFLAKIAIGLSDAYTYTFASGLCFIPVVALLYFFDKKGRTLPKFSLKKFLPTIAGVFLVETALIPFNLAFQKGMASLVGPVSSSYVVITAVLAFIFLKERVTKIQLTGIATTFIEIVLLGIY